MESRLWVRDLDADTRISLIVLDDPGNESAELNCQWREDEMRHQINQRAALSVARMNAYDRRLSAIHEAGHVIMAVYLGYTASAWIHTNETRDPLAEKTWLGHATVPDRPRACDHPHNRMIAVAGMVAERLWKNGHDEEYAEPYGWEDILWDEECMSFSDWWNADCEPGEPDGGLYDVVAEVAGLFMGDLWSDLTDTARVLMTEPETGHTFRPAVNTGSRDAA